MYIDFSDNKLDPYANGADTDQTDPLQRSSLISVHTVCHSTNIFVKQIQTQKKKTKI